MGVSTAYHLARLGVGPVIVLERDTVCSGSTALASGGIRHQYANRLGVELTTHSIVTYERFRDEFGVDPNFRQHGYLILIATDDELATARRSVALQRSLGVAAELLEPAAIRALCPYLNTDDLLGATYTPRDGYADPYLCATAIAARARDLGVVIKQQHEVHGFLRDGNRVRGVTTAAGMLEAPTVVIATGAWSGVVGKLAGVDIPVRPHRRHKFMTAPFRPSESRRSRRSSSIRTGTSRCAARGQGCCSVTDAVTSPTASAPRSTGASSLVWSSARSTEHRCWRTPSSCARGPGSTR